MAASLALTAGGTLLRSPFVRSALKGVGGFVTRNGLKFLRNIPSYLRTAGAAARRVAGFAQHIPLTNSQKSAALGTALAGGQLLGQKLTGGKVSEEAKNRFKNIASENFDRFLLPTDVDTAETVGETGRRVRDTYRSVRDNAPDYLRAASRGARRGAEDRARAYLNRRYGREMDGVYNAMPYYEKVYKSFRGEHRGGGGHRRRPRPGGPMVEEVFDDNARSSGRASSGGSSYTVEEPDD